MEHIKMVDYKEMYLEMVRETECAINILIQVQRRCEEMCISAPEPEIKLLPSEDASALQAQENTQA